jgi:hypothetical protein
MTDFEKARADLPNVPEDVFRRWLDPLIAQQPWDAQHRFWRDVFLYKGLIYWQKLRWIRTELVLHPDRLSDATRARLQQLETALLHDMADPHSSWLKGTRARLKTISRHIVEKGRVPGPLIIHRGSGVIDILEGARRTFMLLAHANSSQRPKSLSMTVDAWVTM